MKIVKYGDIVDELRGSPNMITKSIQKREKILDMFIDIALFSVFLVVIIGCILAMVLLISII